MIIRTIIHLSSGYFLPMCIIIGIKYDSFILPYMHYSLTNRGRGKGRHVTDDLFERVFANFIETIFQWSSLQQTNTGSYNGLATNAGQTIIWISNGLIHWCIYASPDLGEFSRGLPMICLKQAGTYCSYFQMLQTYFFNMYLFKDRATEGKWLSLNRTHCNSYDITLSIEILLNDDLWKCNKLFIHDTISQIITWLCGFWWESTSVLP